MAHFIRVLLVFLIACAVAGAAPPAPADRPSPRTHAHNDYEHAHPLFDALHHGFIGVEADVYLVGNDLRVAHDPARDWTTKPTLQDAYLSPLRDLAKRRSNGGIYADGTPILLLVDIKTAAEPTYRRLHEVLSEYQKNSPGLFTTYTTVKEGHYRKTSGAVTVIVSGNRAREAMKRQATRLAGYDGRMSDVGPDVSANDAPGFVPLISDNRNTVFTGELAWDGTGAVPPKTRAKLEQVVAAVHAEGKLLRFWNLPKDAPPVWAPLYDAGVDLINTDDLPGLAKFIATKSK